MASSPFPVLSPQESKQLLSPCNDKDFSFLVKFFYKEVAPHLGEGLAYCGTCRAALGKTFMKHEAHCIPTGRCALCDEDMTLEITKRAFSQMHESL